MKTKQSLSKVTLSYKAKKMWLGDVKSWSCRICEPDPVVGPQLGPSTPSESNEEFAKFRGDTLNQC